MGTLLGPGSRILKKPNLLNLGLNLCIIHVKIQIQGGFFFFFNQHLVQTEKIKYPPN